MSIVRILLTVTSAARQRYAVVSAPLPPMKAEFQSGIIDITFDMLMFGGWVLFIASVFEIALSEDNSAVMIVLFQISYSWSSSRRMVWRYNFLSKESS